MQPTAVQYTNTTHSTATIEWRITEIGYTPENYFIQYGTSALSLSQRTQSIGSGSDLTITNQIYSEMISGLASNTTYYYRVFASNSFASTTSSIGSFVTVPLRELNRSITNSLSLLIILIQLLSFWFELKGYRGQERDTS